MPFLHTRHGRVLTMVRSVPCMDLWAQCLFTQPHLAAAAAWAEACRTTTDDGRWTTDNGQRPTDDRRRATDILMYLYQSNI